MPKSNVRRALPWFIAAGLSLVLMAVVFIVPFFTLFSNLSSSSIDLQPASTICMPVEDWPEHPVVFARDGVPLPARDLRALLSVRDGAGTPIPLAAYENMTLDVPSGSFSSIARFDSAPFPAGTNICIEVQPEPRLQNADLVVMPDLFNSGMLTMFASVACAEFVLFGIVVAGVIRGIILLCR